MQQQASRICAVIVFSFISDQSQHLPDTQGFVLLFCSAFSSSKLFLLHSLGKVHFPTIQQSNTRQLVVHCGEFQELHGSLLQIG